MSGLFVINGRVLTLKNFINAEATVRIKKLFSIKSYKNTALFFAFPIAIGSALVMTVATVLAAPCGGSGLELNNNGTVTCLLGAPGTYATAITLDGPSSLTIIGSGNYIVSGVISGAGASMTINAGAGNKVIYTNAAPSYTGGTTVATGMLQIGNAGAGKVPAAGGVAVNAGATFAFNTTSYNAIGADFLGAFSGSGTVSVFGASASQTVQYSGAGGAFAGTYNVIAGARFNPNTAGAFSPSAEYALDGTVGGTMNNTTGKLGALSGASTGGVFQGGSSSGTNGFEIGNKNTNTTFSGAIGGTLFVNKLGTGVFLTNGATTHTGPTTITNGVLGGTGGAASSAHTVTAAGTIMGGTGTGNAGTYTAGNLTFAGSTSKLRVNSNGTNAVSNISSKVTTLNGMTVDLLGALTTPGTYDLVAGTSLAGTAVLGTNATGCVVSLATTATKLQLVVADCTPPTATINQAVGQADPIAGPTINYTVVFSEAINPGSFTASDITLSGTSTGAIVGTPTTSDNVTWNVPVTATNGGTVIANMAAGAVTDANGLASTSAATFTDNQITIDNAPLTVTVNQKAGQADPTAANSMFYTVVFSKPIDASTFGVSDITLGTSPSSPAASVTTFTQLNTTTWEFEVKNMANGTTVTAAIGASKVKDLSGNNNTTSTSTDNSVMYQVPPPNVVPQVTNDTTPTLTGQCGANHNLQVVLSGPATHTYTPVCDGAGNWTLTVPSGDSLPDGSYNIVVNDTTSGPLSNPVANQTGALVIDSVVPTVTINQKAGQADPTDSNSASFTIVFSKPVNAASFISGDLTVGGTTGTVTTLTQLTTTTWEAIITGMTSGDVATLSLAANKVTDTAGNNNTASTSTDNSVKYDSTPPATPVITAPTNGTTTNDTTPTIAGAGENGAALTVKIDDVAIFCAEGNPLVVTSGTWTCTPTAPLADGLRTITALQTDPAGNASATSPAVTITVDTAAGPPPTIDSPADDAEITDTTPTITGLGESGSAVAVRDEFGNSLCSTTVDSGGNWSCDSTKNLGEGQHQLVATQTDSAGNAVSGSASTVNVAVNTDDVTAAVEDAAPNNGDGNGDGTVDSEQSGVTSIPNAITGGYATLAVNGGACPNVSHFEVDAESQLAKQDTSFDYPIGLYGFQLECFTVGGTANVTIYLNKVYDTSLWHYRKFDTVTKTYRDIGSFITYGVATVGAKQVTTISFAATDGGPLDEDGVANGVFKDPNGPTITVGVGGLANNLANTGQELIGVIAGALALMLGGLAALYMHHGGGYRVVASTRRR